MTEDGPIIETPPIGIRTRESARWKIKVCGVTTPDDARMVAEAGADWIGINLHPPSPRSVDADRARELVDAIDGRAEGVGLFVDRPASEIAEIAGRAGLRIVQLHGNELAEVVVELRRRGFLVLRAFRLGDRLAVERMASWLREASRIGGLPDAMLVDAFVPGRAGGTGRVIDLGALEALARFPAERGADEDPSPPLILAGGLTPDNVGGLIRRVDPWMVDVASGVESSPGRKQPSRVAAFVAAVRAARSP